MLWSNGGRDDRDGKLYTSVADSSRYVQRREDPITSHIYIFLYILSICFMHHYRLTYLGANDYNNVRDTVRV
jgi:hypothetical protein